MLICLETICTRTIGNKKFPDVSKICRWPGLLLHFCFVHASKLTFVEFLRDFPTFAVQHQKPWGFSWILPSVLRRFFFVSRYLVFTRRFFVTFVTPRGILVSPVRHLGFLRGSTAVWWFSYTASLPGLTCFFLF